MSDLAALVRDVRNRDHRFTVYGRRDDVDAADRFRNRNVEVAGRTLPAGGPAPFVVIEEDGEVVGVASLADVEGLTEPPIRRPDPGSGVSEGFRVFFEVLDDTVFTSMSRAELLAVSREIEERAYRVGTGALRASFQRAAALRAQADVYRTLAADTELAIDVYARPDERGLPAVHGVRVHPLADPAVERHWVVAFDGGGDDCQACGLVAQERPEGYDGFWTADADIVARIAAALPA
ncbi:DICT sensory domain-containing protein [Halobaculum lipolyticum]|uniref:DICT sensory domain-containing protein n=1 Tax=Halobaculum lipolyticum TaxID=3032001 RepID=A0ABD5WA15_9EURY|nr:DICT sensory domain-containing protein [Halobaculum sp. DT31]